MSCPCRSSIGPNRCRTHVAAPASALCARLRAEVPSHSVWRPHSLYLQPDSKQGVRMEDARACGGQRIATLRTEGRRADRTGMREGGAAPSIFRSTRGVGSGLDRNAAVDMPALNAQRGRMGKQDVAQCFER